MGIYEQIDMLGDLIPTVDIDDELRAPADLLDYDTYICAFSGGKDSLGSLLALLEAGVPRDKIELWHHCVDGRGDTHEPFMDWPVTEAYCQAVAAALGIKLYYSWKAYGFLGEMFRENELTKPNYFETPNGLKSSGGKHGKPSTRRMFPQVTANLSQRFCSGYLKVDVCTAAITNQKRFLNKRTLLVTGERAEESPARSKYKTFEIDRADKRDVERLRRHVDRYRIVHGWDEQSVWNIIQRWAIDPHPAYKLGWGRLSCLACIFGSANQWASIRKIAPALFQRIADYEVEFGKTIHRTRSVIEQADKGTPYDTITDELVALAMGTEYDQAVVVDNWALPAGAFGESAGPT